MKRKLHYKLGDVLLCHKHIGITKYVGRLHSNDFQHLSMTSNSNHKPSDIWIGLQLAEAPNLLELSQSKPSINSSKPYKSISEQCLNSIPISDYFKCKYGILIPSSLVRRRIKPYQILTKLTGIFKQYQKCKSENSILSNIIKQQRTRQKLQSTSETSLESSIYPNGNGGFNHHQKITQTHTTTHHFVYFDGNEQQKNSNENDANTTTSKNNNNNQINPPNNNNTNNNIENNNNLDDHEHGIIPKEKHFRISVEPCLSDETANTMIASETPSLSQMAVDGVTADNGDGAFSDRCMSDDDDDNVHDHDHAIQHTNHERNLPPVTPPSVTPPLHAIRDSSGTVDLLSDAIFTVKEESENYDTGIHTLENWNLAKMNRNRMDSNSSHNRTNSAPEFMKLHQKSGGSYDNIRDSHNNAHPTKEKRKHLRSVSAYIFEIDDDEFPELPTTNSNALF